MRVVLLSVLMMVSVVAEAEWSYVGESGSAKLFSDFSTLKETKEGYVRVWTMTSNGKKDPLGFRSFKALRLFDCEQERARSLRTVFFDGELGRGEVTDVLDDDGKWSFVDPTSILGAGMDAVCPKR